MVSRKSTTLHRRHRKKSATKKRKRHSSKKQKKRGKTKRKPTPKRKNKRKVSKKMRGGNITKKDYIEQLNKLITDIKKSGRRDYYLADKIKLDELESHSNKVSMCKFEDQEDIFDGFLKDCQNIILMPLFDSNGTFIRANYNYNKELLDSVKE